MEQLVGRWSHFTPDCSTCAYARIKVESAGEFALLPIMI